MCSIVENIPYFGEHESPNMKKLLSPALRLSFLRK